jgi:hypothetical protein
VMIFWVVAPYSILAVCKILHGATTQKIIDMSAKILNILLAKFRPESLLQFLYIEI